MTPALLTEAGFCFGVAEYVPEPRRPALMGRIPRLRDTLAHHLEVVHDVPVTAGDHLKALVECHEHTHGRSRA